MAKKIKDTLPRKIYKTLLLNSPLCCVDVIFINKQKNKILLFKRNNEPIKGTYYTTGGRLFRNEKLHDCAIRQAKRELGLTIDPKKTFFIGTTEESWKKSSLKGVSYHAVVFLYGYILKNENIKIKFDGQHSDYKWFSFNDKTLHPLIKERVRQILLKI